VLFEDDIFCLYAPKSLILCIFGAVFMKRLSLFGLLIVLSYPLLISAQTCTASTKSEIPDSRYLLNKDGTVTDKQTGLIWMRCPLGQTWDFDGCMGLPKTYQWKTAIEMAKTTVFAGQNDWRLPEQDELQSLLDPHCYKPFINLTAFPNPTDNWFWSSSSNPSNIGSAWLINFFYTEGSFGNKTDLYAVRLVRGGNE
jgi:hypothetical protein